MAASAAGRRFFAPLAGRVLCLDRVTVVDEGDITMQDVRRTGIRRVKGPARQYVRGVSRGALRAVNGRNWG